MAAATTVACPMCTRQLRLPADLVGRMVKCANCGGTFEAKEKRSEPPPSRREPPPATPRPVPARIDSSRSVRFDDDGDDKEPCPFCRKRNRVGARRCRHCGEHLDNDDDQRDDRPWERGLGVRRDSEPHRGPTVLLLGIVSIVCAVVGGMVFWCPPIGLVFVIAGLGMGIPAWVMGQRDLARMEKGEVDPRGRGSTQGGWICGIIGTILNMLAILGVGAMGILMLFSIATAPGPGGSSQPGPRRRVELNREMRPAVVWHMRDVSAVADEPRLWIANLS
jgi:hypothetical protein